MSNGAPPLSISCDGREFQCLGDAAGSPEQGGYDSEYASNGDPNTGRFLMTPTGWALPDQAIELNVSQNDWEYLNDKKNSGRDSDWVVTYVDAIYGARGRMTGKLPWDPMAASATLNLAGPGKIEQK